MKELIEKYLDSTTSEEELQRLRAYFLTHKDDLENYFLESDWDKDDFISVKNKLLHNDVIDKIIAENQQKRPRLKRIIYLSVATAACFFVFFFISKFYTDRTVENSFSENSPQIVYKNMESAVKTIQLPDSSIVELSPNSVVVLEADYNKEKRLVTLTGEAIFHVHKDAQHRFIVSSGNVNTTAIGTIFKVTDNKTGKVSVKLIEGKILVEEKGNSAKAYYLLPGKTIAYENVTREFKLVNDETSPGLSRKPVVDQDPELPKLLPDMENNKDVAVSSNIVYKNDETIFTDVRLADVLKTLAREYNVKIAYPTEKTSKIRFAGSVNKQQDIRKILLDIAIMNQFRLEEDTISQKFTFY